MANHDISISALPSRSHRARDLTGQRFTRLTPLSISGRDRQGRLVWLCACDCGARKAVPSRHLVQRSVRSCGCLLRDVCAVNGRVGAAKISGSKSHLYKPHLTESDRLDRRNLVTVREWRSAVYARDKHTCNLCGSVGGKLQAHHLDCWADYPARRFDASNGVTLCRGCHRAFHISMGGERKPCSESDYLAFKAVWYIEREIKLRAP